ncbi:hypothetical protein J6590_055495 [Homalodisca vitripennis]|nr:hypothetical protein J6590_055495 [Homalodisca vitripennis]
MTGVYEVPVDSDRFRGEEVTGRFHSAMVKARTTSRLVSRFDFTLFRKIETEKIVVPRDVWQPVVNHNHRFEFGNSTLFVVKPS